MQKQPIRFTLPKLRLLALCLLCVSALAACTPRAKPAPKPVPSRPTPSKPPAEPMDTVRWTPSSGKPPIVNPPVKPTPSPGKPVPIGSGETYRIAMMLPFLTKQAEGDQVPDKSRLAVQFYAGSKVALEQISKDLNINLIVDVYDTQANDSDFEQLMLDRRLDKADVFIGPVRTSHVQKMAEWVLIRNKILISPEALTSDLTKQNRGFIQTNPSLRAHCEGILRHVLKRNQADAITLVCKEKEADRLAYFQSVMRAGGKEKLAEIRMLDNSTFTASSLKSRIKAGKTSVFILPHWASQDFVMSFLNALKSAKGSNRVEVYGMPQWKDFESIDPEFLTDLNVHISSASWVDYSSPNVRDFQRKFYESTGMIPDDDGFNGYDVTLFAARMLAFHGLSFPERLSANSYTGLHGRFDMTRVSVTGGLGALFDRYDYLENTFVHILKYGPGGYEPVFQP